MIRKAGPDHLTTCTKQNPKIEQIPQLGGVAQLGERTVRIRKVESSILFVSTIMHLSEPGVTIVVLPRVFALLVPLPTAE